MTKKNIAVIGGSGFIGTRLCGLLAEREDIDFKIIDLVKSEKYPNNWTLGDVRDYQSLVPAFESVDVVINLAAEHKDNVQPVSKYYATNVEGQKNICKAMDANGVKHLIFTSSVAVYGFVTEDTGEDGAINPFHEYGDSKYKAELVANEWLDEGKHLSIIRPTVVFGEGNRGNVYNLLRQIASGKFLMIGSGKNKKSMAYVGNVAAFINHLIDNANGTQVFNYADKPDFNMNTLVSTVNTALGKEAGTVRIPYFLGLAGGYAFDVLSWLLRRELPISSIRIKKFCAITQFKSRTDMCGFAKPQTLQDGLSATVRNEFANTD
ncbi:Nucleoside-diphosphate-sugar epimerase [Alteromonadaceae bacterium Bs31]|nr:Nucleoside-diphosphate-sugar epimerase [Alteromonadaceae bacterium Bs31]